MRLWKGFFLLVLGILPVCSEGQFYSGSNLTFGKNRLQFRDFLWRYYDYPQFKTYFYKGGKGIAQYSARSAQRELKDLQTLMDFNLDEKVEFIIFNKQSEFQQSNIGYGKTQYNIGGVTRIVGSKVFLYYEGDHQKLDEQIRAGIAKVLLNQMMYGGNWKDVIKNSTLLNVPEWYLNGFISYASKDWSVELDSRVRDGVLSGRYEDFNRLSGKDAVFAGHAIWNYIANVYGEGVIPNILYMTKMSRNVESGFLFVLGVSLKTLTQDYLEYYQKQYKKDEKFRNELSLEEVPTRIKDHRTYYQLEVSPDGKYVTYVADELGKSKLWLYNIEEDKRKKIYKLGHKLDRIRDFSYPVIAWHPEGKAFSFVTEEEGELLMSTYLLEEEKIHQKRLFELDKILDLEYAPDGKHMVFSGVEEGQTDIYYYFTVGNRQENLTDDIFDDLHPSFVDNGNKIIFSSNRPHDTLNTDIKNRAFKRDQDKDVFVYDLNTRNDLLDQVTNTEDVNETQPTGYDSVHYTYLSDANGITNRYLARFDSSISHIDTVVHYKNFTVSHPLTNYSRNVKEYEVKDQTGRYSVLTYENGIHRFYVGSLEDDQVMKEDLRKTAYRKSRDLAMKRKEIKKEREASKEKKDTISSEPAGKIKKQDPPPPKLDSGEVDIDNYTFYDEHGISENNRTFPDSSPEKMAKLREEKAKGGRGEEKGKSPFSIPELENYQLNFVTEQVTSQLDNGYLNESYQRFNPASPGFVNPGLNGFITFSIQDLFEDYRVRGGVRLSGNLRNNEFFIQYQDLSKRLDKDYLFLRQSFVQQGSNAVRKLQTYEFKYNLTWPFSEIASVKGGLNLRNDNITTVATESRSLQAPTINEYQAGAKLSYVLDNTRHKALNIYNGWRLKLFGEYYQRLVNFEDGDFFVVGLDTRYYQKIHRNLIWANRIAGSTSFGSRKLVYYMGGVDNWLLPQFNNDIPIDMNQGYAYQTIATPMRGFQQNSRNGNSFALINSELRFPVFDYFMSKPVKSDFLKNFQMVAFGDIGTAWTGPDPYSEDNSFNVNTIEQYPLKIVIKNQREPIVGGYGFGLRSRVWGYFVRADWAWGVDDGEVQDPQFYLSLSLDF